MRWMLFALAAAVELGVLYHFFTKSSGDERVCANCSSKYDPAATRCPRCEIKNPRVSAESDDHECGQPRRVPIEP